MPYHIDAYPLKDGRWGGMYKFIGPSLNAGQFVVSEPTEVDAYFPTKEQAIDNIRKYLRSLGVTDADMVLGLSRD